MGLDTLPNRPNTTPREQEVAEVLVTATAQRNQLNDQFVTTRIEQATNWSQDDIKKAAGENLGKKRLEFLKQVVEINKQALQANRLRQRMMDIMPNKENKQLEDMMDRLMAPPPEYEDKPSKENNRYIWMSYHVDSQNQKHYIYGLNAAALRQDEAIIQRYMDAASPEQKPLFGELLACLKRYEQMDPYTMQTYTQRAEQTHSMDQGASHMARMLIVLGAGAAAITTGTIALFQKKFSVTPFIYLAALFWAKDPQIFTKMMAPKEQKDWEQAGNILHEPHFQALCRQYDIQGPQWAGLVEDIMKGTDTDLTKALKALRADNFVLNDKGEPQNEDVRTFVKSKPALKDKLIIMMQTRGNDPTSAKAKSQFIAFVEMLQNANRTQSREFIEEFIRKGLWNPANAKPPVI